MKFIAVQDHGGQAPIPCLVCVSVSKRGSEGVRSERGGEGRRKGKKRGAERRREEEGRGWKGPRGKKKKYVEG